MVKATVHHQDILVLVLASVSDLSDWRQGASSRPIADCVLLLQEHEKESLGGQDVDSMWLCNA
jgi:hypothetical protein